MKYKKSYLREIKRAHGGVSWCGVLTYKDENGKWKQTSKIFDHEQVNTERKAKEALETWRMDMEQAAINEAEAAAKAAEEAERIAQRGGVDPSKITVAKYLARFIDQKEATEKIERSTVADYRYTTKYLFCGSAPIGNKRLDKLTRGDVERWEAGLKEEGTSSVVVGKAHRLLRQCMRHAVIIEDLPKDPTLGVEPPKRTARQPNALDAAGRSQVATMLDNMQPTPLKVGIALALYAGMRQGEICGLRWKDVELDQGVLHVREAIGHAEGGTYTKDPKTDGSRRDIPLTPQLIEILRERRVQMMTDCLNANVPFTNDLYVLGYINGQYYGPKTLGREWAAISKAHNLIGMTGKRVTFHDLRHTFATLAITEGIDVKTVSSILGHANAAMTLNIYASADPDAKRRAAEVIGAAMARPISKAEVIQYDRTGTADE